MLSLGLYFFKVVENALIVERNVLRACGTKAMSLAILDVLGYFGSLVLVVVFIIKGFTW